MISKPMNNAANVVVDIPPLAMMKTQTVLSVIPLAITVTGTTPIQIAAVCMTLLASMPRKCAALAGVETGISDALITMVLILTEMIAPGMRTTGNHAETTTLLLSAPTKIAASVAVEPGGD